MWEWLVKTTVVWCSLLVLAFVAPLRFVISLALMSFRDARLLGAGPLGAGVAVVWVLSLMTASLAFLITEHFDAAALAFAGWALPFGLLWLLRGLDPGRDER